MADDNLCKHGSPSPHGEIGKDWCAGPPRSWYFEAFRSQLEEQMNLDTSMFARIDGAREDVDDALRTEPKPPAEAPTYGLWQINAPSNVSPWSYEVWPSPSVDRLRNFIPLGWFGWGEMHWYGDTPIYDTVCEDLGFQPL